VKLEKGIPIAAAIPPAALSSRTDGGLTNTGDGRAGARARALACSCARGVWITGGTITTGARILRGGGTIVGGRTTGTGRRTGLGLGTGGGGTSTRSRSAMISASSRGVKAGFPPATRNSRRFSS